MTNLDYKEKVIGIASAKDVKGIIVTHITIRQSIFILHLRILVLEIIAAFFIIVFHLVFSSTLTQNFIGQDLISFNIPLFVVLIVIKLAILIFIILQWLNQYYEITTHEIRLKKGLFFKREKRFLVEHIGSAKLEQGVFGRVFNFGTIKLFNWATEQDELLYLIHNPMKYQRILETILPTSDEEKKTVREHILEPEDDSV